MPKALDFTGQKFGKLTVIKKTEERIGSYVVWECLCECGKKKKVSSAGLKRGDYYSCGCSKLDGIKKHINNDSKDGTRITSLKLKKDKRNTSGFKGVSKSRGKWRAYIGFKGKQIGLGNYKNLEDAVEARKNAESKYFGEYIKEGD